MGQLVAKITELVSLYVNAKDLFQQFAARDVHFVQTGGTVSIRDSVGEALLLHSGAGYVRGHLSPNTIGEWSEAGLIYQDDTADDEDQAVFRLTDLGYRLGR